MKPKINEEIRRSLLLILLEMLLNASSNNVTDEPTFRRCVYYYNKMIKEHRDLTPLYGNFRRTHYGPYNEELFNDIKALIQQKCIVFNNQKLTTSKNNNNQSPVQNVYINTIKEYLKAHPCDTKKFYPLEEMRNVEVGAELP